MNTIPGDQNSTKNRFYRTIQEFEDTQRELLVAEAQKSESRFLYWKLNYNLDLEDERYFYDLLIYKQISLIFKTRCEILDLNGEPYNGSFDQFCSLCKLRSKENCFHLIVVRPIYAPQTQQYLGAKTLIVQETRVLLNGYNWKKLYLFVKSAYKYRMLLVIEFD